MPNYLRSFLHTLTWLALALPAAAALAQAPTLDAVAKSISHDVIAAIREDREIQAGNHAKLAHLVAKMFLPHVDARRMTQLAMGAIWLHATLEQQERLAQEFTTLVVHAYSAALASYSDQVMVVSRLRADTGDTDVPVRFEIDRPGTQPIAIGYSLEITPSGWKVYDITIDGTSLVSAFHGAFSEQVRNHGIEGLIGLLSAANRHNSRRMAPVQS